MSAKPVNKQIGPFLRFDRLAAGDVVLMRGNGLGSSLIAIGSAGEFSHAAIILSRKGELILFDSLVNGVGEMSLFAGVRGLVETEWVAFVELSGTSTFAVFRHPLIRSVSALKMQQVSDRLVDEYSGKQYSRHERLPGAIRRLKFVEPLLRPIFRAFDRRSHPEGAYGPFCSELTVFFFERLGLHLFEDRTTANRVAPNDLVNSRLIEVEGAVVAKAAITQLTWIGVDSGLREGSRRWRGMIVQARTSLAEVEDLNERLGEIKRGIEETNRNKAEILVQGAMINWQRHKEQFLSLESECLAAGKPIYARIFSNIRIRYEHHINSLHVFSEIQPGERSAQNVLEAIVGVNRTSECSLKLSQIGMLLNIRKLSDFLNRYRQNLSHLDRWKLKRSWNREIRRYKSVRRMCLHECERIRASESTFPTNGGRG